MRDKRAGEHGAALLTVLLLVAMVSVLAGTALEKLRMSTRLAANAGAIEQARAYGYAAETIAVLRVDQLLASDGARTTLAGDWNGTPYPVPVPGGLATLTVRDGGNCFNLNSLVHQSSSGTNTVDFKALHQFERLLRAIGIAGATASRIAAASTDWIDSDTTPLPGGAEDSAYQGADPAYRTPGALMADRSELRAIDGMTPDLYKQIAPWVCALPKAELSRINVNTLQPEQAPLFMMLLPDNADIGPVRAALLGRPPQGFASTNTFWQSSALQGVPHGDADGQAVVRTRWFDLTVDVALARVDLHQTALIDASRPPARIVSRAWGDPA